MKFQIYTLSKFEVICFWLKVAEAVAMTKIIATRNEWNLKIEISATCKNDFS
jgi:hypothetical protein